MPTSYKEIFSRIGSLCVSGTVASVIGAKVLNDAGYNSFSPSVSAGEGALGGAILGAGFAAVGSLIRNPDIAAKFYRYGSMPLTLMSGVLGRAILEASHEWASKEALAASATGMGVSIGAVVGLGVALLCCARCCCLDTEELKTFVKSLFNSSAALETAGVVALRDGDLLAALTQGNTMNHGTFTPLTGDPFTAEAGSPPSSFSFSPKV